MSQLNDAKFETLRTAGFTGVVNDMLLPFYKLHGATANSLQDAEREFLFAQGAALANVNDMWFELLGGLGFEGSLNDRLLLFWLAGADPDANNIYVNFELAGGDPPTAHTIGFGTAPHSIDAIGDGFFEFHSNTDGSLARTYLNYELAVNNPALTVGNTYRMSVECENISGNNYGVALNMASLVNITIGNANTQSLANQTLRLFSEFVIDAGGYVANIRFGTGTTSNNVTEMKFRRPKIVDLGIV